MSQLVTCELKLEQKSFSVSTKSRPDSNVAGHRSAMSWPGSGSGSKGGGGLPNYPWPLPGPAPPANYHAPGAGGRHSKHHASAR